ncbi:hypothetical protein EGW08_015698, partial [Elysia chlorotica]
ATDSTVWLTVGFFPSLMSVLRRRQPWQVKLCSLSEGEASSSCDSRLLKLGAGETTLLLWDRLNGSPEQFSPVWSLLQTEPSLEAQGDSSRTLSSRRCLTPWMYGAVARLGRLLDFSACGCVHGMKLECTHLALRLRDLRWAGWTRDTVSWLRGSVLGDGGGNVFTSSREDEDEAVPGGSSLSDSLGM